VKCNAVKGFIEIVILRINCNDLHTKR